MTGESAVVKVGDESSSLLSEDEENQQEDRRSTKKGATEKEKATKKGATKKKRDEKEDEKKNKKNKKKNKKQDKKKDKKKDNRKQEEEEEEEDESWSEEEEMVSESSGTRMKRAGSEEAWSEEATRQDTENTHVGRRNRARKRRRGHGRSRAARTPGLPWTVRGRAVLREPVERRSGVVVVTGESREQTVWTSQAPRGTILGGRCRPRRRRDVTEDNEPLQAETFGN
jgi:hypothetical protein